MVDSIKYDNTLPPGFNTWTKLFFDCELGVIVGHVTRHNMREKLLFNPGTLMSSWPYPSGDLQLDVDFLKARLFDEFMLGTHIDKSASGKIRAIAFTHPDQSAFEEEYFKIALRELDRLTQVVSMIRGAGSRNSELLNT